MEFVVFIAVAGLAVLWFSRPRTAPGAWAEHVPVIGAPCMRRKAPNGSWETRPMTPGELQDWQSREAW